MGKTYKDSGFKPQGRDKPKKKRLKVDAKKFRPSIKEDSSYNNIDDGTYDNDNFEKFTKKR